jgi:hypothetical protein
MTTAVFSGHRDPYWCCRWFTNGYFFINIDWFNTNFNGVEFARKEHHTTVYGREEP